MAATDLFVPKAAEGDALSPNDFVTLEKRLEAPPHDRDSLFAVMADRLADLTEDLAHDDFTDRRTLLKIDQEVEMQLTLARRLRDAAKGAYVVAREDEVADSKKTDIRLAAVRGDQKAVIEVKIADHWSLPELENALQGQLVGQYLRHSNCRAGCLLLTYHGKKYWIHPHTGIRLNFRDLVELLRLTAKNLEERAEVRVIVQPIDLTGPAAEESC